MTRRRADNRPDKRSASMGLKDSVENHPVIWTLGTALAAFLAGIAAYDGVLRISQSQVVPADARILAEDERVIKESEYQTLSKASNSLDGTKTELEALKEKRNLVADKETFLALYVRYAIAKQHYRKTESDPSSPEFKSYLSTQRALDDFVRQRVKAERLVLHKGGRLATIEFSDGLAWEIPEELHSTEAGPAK